MNIQNVPKFFKYACADSTLSDLIQPLPAETTEQYAARMSLLSAKYDMPFSRNDFLMAIEPDPCAASRVEELGSADQVSPRECHAGASQLTASAR